MRMCPSVALLAQPLFPTRDGGPVRYSYAEYRIVERGLRNEERKALGLGLDHSCTEPITSPETAPNVDSSFLFSAKKCWSVCGWPYKGESIHRELQVQTPTYSVRASCDNESVSS